MIKHLKKITFTVAIVTCNFMARAQNDSVAAAQHKLLNMPKGVGGGKNKNTDPRMAWYPQAGLGVFLHWGAIATYGSGDLSWCMMANKGWPDDGTVTPNYYYSLMNTWNPAKYNPDEIIKQVKAAGFEYAVLTTKHHDGYTLWPSKYGDLGTHTKMKGRDLVKPFIDACRKYGVKVGLYYSPPDWWFDRKYHNWSFDNKILLDMDHKPLVSLVPVPAGHDEKRKELVSNQVRELLTKYGKIDLMWFDGGSGEISNDEVRKLQPGIVINRRNGPTGDFDHTEGELPKSRTNGWFETCDPIWPTRWWAYSASDSYDDAATVLANLIRLRAWGSNYLANMALDGDGAIPSPALGPMRDMALWMKHSQESVTNVEGGNYPEKSVVPVTNKANTIYAFAFPNYQAELKISTSVKPKNVILLRTGQILKYRQEGDVLWVTIPPKDRSRMPDAVKISY